MHHRPAIATDTQRPGNSTIVPTEANGHDIILRHAADFFDEFDASPEHIDAFTASREFGINIYAE